MSNELPPQCKCGKFADLMEDFSFTFMHVKEIFKPEKEREYVCKKCVEKNKEKKNKEVERLARDAEKAGSGFTWEEEMDYNDRLTIE